MRQIVGAMGLTAVGGLLIWTVVLVAALLTRDPALGWIAMLLLFGQIVVVPLGLRLLNGRRELERSLLRGAAVGFRFAAVAAVMALAVPPGPISAGIGALYLVPAFAVGAAAVVRLAASAGEREAWRAPEVARAAASGFLVVGAVTFVLHRAGEPVLGFGEPIVQLTAVHFHFAGFGLLLMAGEVARRRSRGGVTAVWLLVVGMVATAVGFLTIPQVQLGGALLVASGLVAVTVAGLGRSCWLTVPPVAAIGVGALAIGYAVGEAIGAPVVDVPTMAVVHGTLAAFGVVFAGLLGWRMETMR